LQNEAVIYCKLFHFKEALKCCDNALELTKESADIYYRRSQALLYNKGSSYDDLTQAIQDIDIAIEKRPKEEKYKRHKELIIETINAKKEHEKKMIESLINTAAKSFERLKDTAQQKQVSITAEKPFEYRVLKK
jgi:tetratricopeptide (TPR) repeat protein